MGDAGVLVGEAARLTAVSVATLHHYDTIGLVPATRDGRGRRRYPDAALHRVRLVRALRALGCSLDDIARILEDGPAPRGVAQRRLEQLDAQAAALDRAREVLRHILACGCRDLTACDAADRWVRTDPPGDLDVAAVGATS